MSYDVIIRGGTVVDGTGAAPRTADVAISDGMIAEVGRVSGSARRTIDADGLTVTPGFVDIHTHFDGQATWDPHLTPSCWHGVTTAILGNCGIGFAPVRADRHDWLIELMEGVEDIPGSALAEGIKWEWETFGEYLDALERMPRAVDIGTQIPHAAVRGYVMGDRALEAPTGDDLEAMGRAVVEGLQAGALGLSFGRTAGHRSATGEYVPGTFSEEDELAALMAAMAQAGTGVLQVVPAGVGGEMGGDQRHSIDAEIEWINRLGTQYRIHRANAAGANVRPQVASRAFGMLMGHQSRMNPFRHRPTYRALMELPFAERIARLRDPDMKARILAEPQDPSDGPAADRLNRHTFARLYPLGAGLDYEPDAQNSIAAIALRGPRSMGCHLRHPARREWPRIPAAAPAQLRGEQLRPPARHDVGPGQHPGPWGRGRPLRHRVRREHDHLPPDPLDARSHAWPEALARMGGAAPHPRSGPPLRAR
jgi:N-acyl-D-amino-acid deacylase